MSYHPGGHGADDIKGGDDTPSECVNLINSKNNKSTRGLNWHFNGRPGCTR